MNKRGDVYFSFWYAGHIRQMLKDIKYEQDKEAVEIVSKAIEFDVKRLFEVEGVEAITSVPSYERDNISLVVWKIRKRLDFNIWDGIAKTVNNKSQCILTGVKKKRENVKGVFELIQGTYPKKVLLIDNVITSGATMEEVKKLLESEGIEVICYAVACTARNGKKGEK